MRRTSSNVSSNSSGSGGNYGGGGDWRSCLSPVSLERVTNLEASRDNAESSVQEMSAAMKELQQIERKNTTKVSGGSMGSAAAVVGGGGDSLEKWQQSIN